MRLSIIVLALIPAAFAAPIPAPRTCERTSQVVTPSDILTDDINDATEALAIEGGGGGGAFAGADLSAAVVGAEAPEVPPDVPAPALSSTPELSQ